MSAPADSIANVIGLAPGSITFIGLPLDNMRLAFDRSVLAPDLIDLFLDSDENIEGSRCFSILDADGISDHLVVRHNRHGCQQRKGAGLIRRLNADLRPRRRSDGTRKADSGLI
jgi:hypothetical protein